MVHRWLKTACDHLITVGHSNPGRDGSGNVYFFVLRAQPVKHIPFLDRPFTSQSAISRWVIQQLPPSLAVDGRGLVRTMTAAEMSDTPGVVEACIDLVSSASDSNKNFKEITEMIGAAIPGGEQQGRRPAGLGKGGGRCGDAS